MKLLDYLKRNGLTDDQFAGFMGGGHSGSAVRKWKYGERTPKLPELVRIEEITDGEVKPADFLPFRIDADPQGAPEIGPEAQAPAILAGEQSAPAPLAGAAE